jgi:hypothetical protein
MQDVAGNLEDAVRKSLPNLRAIPARDAESRPAPGKWSKKEILGHLIDSAANNHQRFVRAQLEDPLVFPGYAQEFWVNSQGYQEAAWGELIDLWAAYNRQLARVIAQIPAEKLEHSCRIGDSNPVTLDFLVRDYVRHLEHHLRQILA